MSRLILYKKTMGKKNRMSFASNCAWCFKVQKECTESVIEKAYRYNCCPTKDTVS